MKENNVLLIAILVCFTIIVAFGVVFSGLLGGFIGGLVAGLIAKGITKGAVAGFVAAIFAATLLTILSVIGIALFDEVIIGRLLWTSSEHSVVGTAILLEFLGIGISAIGGLMGGLLRKMRRV